MAYADLTGRKILVTGASSGIGQASAIELSKQGAKIVLCGRNLEHLEETRKQLSGEGHIVIPFDVSAFDCYDDVFGKAVADGERLNGLVHCAGIQKAVPLRVMTPEVIHKVMDTNFTSFVMLCSMYSKRKYAEGGSIVSISGLNVHKPQKCMTVYVASKAALEGVTRTLAIEFAEQQKRINCIVAGFIETPMTKSLDVSNLDEVNAKSLLGTGKPEDIAKTIIFLMSDESRFTTGRCLYVDGGMF